MYEKAFIILVQIFVLPIQTYSFLAILVAIAIIFA